MQTFSLHAYMQECYDWHVCLGDAFRVRVLFTDGAGWFGILMGVFGFWRLVHRYYFVHRLLLGDLVDRFSYFLLTSISDGSLWIIYVIEFK